MRKAGMREFRARRHTTPLCEKDADSFASADAVCIFRHDEEAVGASHGGDVAAALPGNECDFRNRTSEGAGGGQEARETRLRFYIGGQARQRETRLGVARTGKSA